MAVEVKVVQDPGEHYIMSFLTGDGNVPLWLDYVFKGATAIRTVDDFVRVCLQTAGEKGRIDYIQINGHGNDTGFRIGNDRIELGTLPGFRQKLATIAPVLNKGCAVEIAACKAGAATELFRQFSLILGGVSIIGFLVPQSGGGGFVSPPVVVTPGGSYQTPAPASGSAPNTPPPTR
ncbi:MAG: hypothetical protein JSS81_08880 [Acidobacteria bacterium]|nr:hypothetical protein [Acidobacteriota bacterium]